MSANAVALLTFACTFGGAMAAMAIRHRPATSTERWFKTEALKLSEEVVKTRWRAIGAGSASFGLFSPRNGTVIVVLGIAAVSVAAAMFLVLELDGPYDGVIKVSSAPLRYALANLGQ